MKNKIILLSLVHLYTLSSWSVISKEDNITILAKPAVSKDATLPFKASATIDADIETVTNTLRDFENKNKWSPKLKNVKTHEKISDDEFIFSEYYETPWPATDREFLLRGKLVKISDTEYEILASSVDEKYKSPDHIQAQVNFLNLKMKEVAPKQTQIEFEFHGDMKGYMPIWLMNLIQKKWPMRFIQGLRTHISKNEARTMPGVSL